MERKLIPSVFVILAVALVAIVGSSLWADEPQPTSPRSDPGNLPAADSRDTRQDNAMQTYLGVGIEPLPRALGSHLHQLLRDGEGVMVTHVAPDSPAAQAGLKADDIITSYDGRKIYSSEQMVRLVQSDKPGHEAELGIIDGGQPRTLNVALGAREDRTGVARRAFRRPTEEQTFTETTAEQDDSWRSFDSMTLTRLDANRFKADIQYRDKSGKMTSHSFRGTRDELRKDINAERDLPPSERGHLLRAIDMAEQPLGIDVPVPEGAIIRQ